jgi:hypothetical protein
MSPHWCYLSSVFLRRSVFVYESSCRVSGAVAPLLVASLLLPSVGAPLRCSATAGAFLIGIIGLVVGEGGLVDKSRVFFGCGDYKESLGGRKSATAGGYPSAVPFYAPCARVNKTGGHFPRIAGVVWRADLSLSARACCSFSASKTNRWRPPFLFLRIQKTRLPLGRCAR